MKYMGSKNRISKHLLPIMLKNRKPNQYWVEPFVGGGNMIDKVEGLRLGADYNKYCIDALITIRDSLEKIPKNSREFTEQDYRKLVTTDDLCYKGYASFAFSFGAKFMGGWSRDSMGKRDYVEEAYKNACKQSPLLQGVILQHCSYDKLAIPNNSIIYCDPPYSGTTEYKDSFDSNLFWEWCREKHNEGHEVFISEYNAPEDFECLWKKSIRKEVGLVKDRKMATEKLFIYKGAL